MRSLNKIVLSVIACIPIVIAASPDVRACACCSDFGERLVYTKPIESWQIEELAKLKFSNKAELFTGERDASDVKGISATSEVFDVQVSRKANYWTFEFIERSDRGHVGTLSLKIPHSLSVFEIDPRFETFSGNGEGPKLYKEWKLTSKATGTGIFSPGLGPNALMTLIVQGAGNTCTTAQDFLHWTLVVFTPEADFSLFGDFEKISE